MGWDFNLPWFHGIPEFAKPDRFIRDSFGKVVAHLDGPLEGARANAALIVRAVNTHEELVAALEDLVRRCDGDEGVRADGSNIQTIAAHAALKRAKGES